MNKLNKLAKSINRKSISIWQFCNEKKQMLASRSMAVLKNTDGDGVHTSHLGWIILSVSLMLVIGAALVAWVVTKGIPGVTADMDSIFDLA